MSFDSSPTMHQYPLLTGSQMGVLNNLTGILKGQIGQGVESYGGSTWAPASGLQTGAFDLVSQLLSGEGPMQGQMFAGLESLMQPWSPEQATQWWEQAVKAPAMQAWETDIMPGVMEQFAAVDAAGGGGARTALGRAGAELSTNLGATLAGALAQDKGMSNQQLLQAAGLAGQYPMGLAQLAGGMGQMERGIESERLYEPYQKWLTSQPYNNPWLQYLSPALGTQAYGQYAEPGTSGFWPGMLFGTGALLKGITGFF
jgi:hypothetical protein